MLHGLCLECVFGCIDCWVLMHCKKKKKRCQWDKSYSFYDTQKVKKSREVEWVAGGKEMGLLGGIWEPFDLLGWKLTGVVVGPSWCINAACLSSNLLNSIICSFTINLRWYPLKNSWFCSSSFCQTGWKKNVLLENCELHYNFGEINLNFEGVWIAYQALWS